MANRAVVVEGYGARLYVERSHLVIVSGFPDEMEELRFARGRPELDRILVRARAGSVSIEAFDWCARMGITLAFVASDSTLVNCLIPDRPHDGPLRRAQAYIAVSDHAAAFAQDLLQNKLRSQVEAIERDFGRLGIGSQKSRSAAVSELEAAIKALPKDTTLRQLLVHEGYAAKVYWGLLNGTPLPWPAWCLKRIPRHWAFINPRFSGGRNGVRDARDPLNAVLNYCYTLLEVETRIACASVGLDPDLGLLHVDDRLRESFIYDLLEPIRAKADVLALDLLRKDGLRPSMFHELRDGVVRIDPDHAKTLAVSLMPRFATLALSAANDYARRLRRIKVPYRLVRTERLPIAAAADAPETVDCKYCKERLPRKGLKFCGRECFLRYSAEVSRPIEKAQEKLAEMRAAGLSPGHGGEAAKKRGTKIAESNQRRSMQLSPAELRARKAEQMRGYRAAKKRSLKDNEPPRASRTVPRSGSCKGRPDDSL